MTNLHFEFISDQSSFETLMSQCHEAEYIALDTEFVRFNTFYPLFGLVQICDRERIYLIDPVSLTDLSPLKFLLEDESVVKILHSCSEDLEVFLYHLDCIPRSLHDTQIAAAILGDDFSMSYQALVAKVTGHHLPKDETRSDWMQRPLSEAQCRYAALDVAYLPEIYLLQKARLIELDRLAWMNEESQRVLTSVVENSDMQNYYLRVKTAWKLDRQQLQVLKHLCAWREQEARDRDMPRNRVMADKLLYGLARSDAFSKEDIEASDLSSGQIRRYVDTLVKLINKALMEEESHWPAQLERPVPSNGRELIKQLRDRVEEEAKRLGCAAEILAKKKQLEALVRSRDSNGTYQLPVDFHGWRQKAIGDPLLQWLNNDSNGKGEA